MNAGAAKAHFLGSTFSMTTVVCQWMQTQLLWEATTDQQQETVPLLPQVCEVGTTELKQEALETQKQIKQAKDGDVKNFFQKPENS